MGRKDSFVRKFLKLTVENLTMMVYHHLNYALGPTFKLFSHENQEFSPLWLYCFLL